MNRICGHCGNELKDDESVCPKCKNYVGVEKEKDIDDDKEEHREKNNKSRSNVSTTIIIFLCLAFFIGLIVMALIFGDNEKIDGITMLDFSTMDKETAKLNCENNNIKCSFVDEYSDTVEAGKFISQSIEANRNNVNPKANVIIKFSLGKKENVTPDIDDEPTNNDDSNSDDKEAALRMAKEEMDAYDDYTYYGLIEELKSEFSNKTATYAADNIDVNWNNLALKYARELMEDDDYSYNELAKELEKEFTNSQTNYALNKVANWNDVAVKRAREYLEDYDYTYQEMVDELESDGFTHDQAVYASKKVVK